MDNLFFREDLVHPDILEPGKVSRKVRAHGDKLMIVEVYFEAGSEGAAHEHLHEQITYCLEGEFDFTSGGVAHRMRQGDSLLVPGGVFHGVKCLSKGRLLDAF